MNVKFVCKAMVACMFLGAVMTSCGDEKDSTTFVPSTTEISGDLSGCFTVEQAVYTPARNKKGERVLDIQLRRTDKMLPFPSDVKFEKKIGESNGKNVKADFGVVFISETDDTLLTIKPCEQTAEGFTNVDDVDERLSKGGKEGRLRIHIPESLGNCRFKVLSGTQQVIY